MKKKPSNYFLKGNNLKFPEQKYCRCILHVLKKNHLKCNKQRQFNKKTRPTDKPCLNPYAICASSVKDGARGSRTCFYDFTSKDIPDEEVVHFAYLNYKSISDWSKNKKYGTIYYYVTNKKISKLRELVSEWYLSKLSKVSKNKK